MPLSRDGDGEMSWQRRNGLDPVAITNQLESRAGWWRIAPAGLVGTGVAPEAGVAVDAEDRA
jgi:hypothetical protein